MIDSDGNMKLSQDGERMREKRGNNLAGTSAKTIKSNEDYGTEIKERIQEGWSLNSD